MIGKHARSTLRPEVLSGFGFFGGKIASALARHDTIGIDLVNHCVNDILTCSAKPLFFLDYIATGKLVPKQVEAIARGLAQACREVGCALIGGETAEMPGLYAAEDYDLVGFIVGVVEREKLITGKTISIGDAIISLPSSGLHTNGYSLVRKVFDIDPAGLNAFYSELGRTLGEELLEPHRCYYHQLKPLLPFIEGIAHITGGGLTDNVPRILPQDMAAQLHSRAWTVPPIFQLIQQRGNVDKSEMYHIFNMGIGMVLVCSPDNVDQLTGQLPEAHVIGQVVKQVGEARIVIN
jgi:phosphoribosylformylglycinamidine cyclo-ligase